jgi:hypothetical protein
MIHAVQIIQQLRITRVFVDSSGANGDFVKCSGNLSCDISLERVGSYPFRAIFVGSILKSRADVGKYADLG